MSQDFSSIMANHSDEELIAIVTIKRADYQPEAVDAAEKELEKRKIDVKQRDEVGRRLSDQLNSQKDLSNQRASSWLRFINYLVDTIIIMMAAGFFSFIVADLIQVTEERAVKIISFLIIIGIFFAYYVILETKFQKTLGKMLTKTKVVMKDGRKPTSGEISLRTVCRFVPFDRISYLFTRNGIHDYLSKTMVIEEG